MDTKRKFLFFAALAVGSLLPVNALTVQLFVDGAPNVYGSADYDGWLSAAKANVASSSFVNMGHSVNPTNVGTTNFDIRDEVVYSFGDLGRRLSFIYWVPGATVQELENADFQISLLNVWDGAPLDFYDYYYGQTWLTPTTWVEANGGVFGIAGMAWWGAYGVNTQAALDAEIADWAKSWETWTFRVSMNGQEVNSITAYRSAVPDVSATFALVLASLAGVAALRRRRLS